MNLQMAGKNTLETDYAQALQQRFPQDFDSAYKTRIKRKYHERL